MKLKIIYKPDNRPQERTIKVFAIFPIKLFFAGSDYWVWLEYYYQDEYLQAGSYRIRSKYPIFGNNNTYPL